MGRVGPDTQTETRMDSVVVAAVIATVVSLAWSWAERAAGNRQALYEAQLAAGAAVSAALWAAVADSASWNSYLDATARYAPILPTAAISALGAVVNAHDADPAAQLGVHAGAVVKAMRQAFGTDQLTQQTLDRIGRR